MFGADQKEAQNKASPSTISISFTRNDTIPSVVVLKLLVITEITKIFALTLLYMIYYDIDFYFSKIRFAGW